MNSLRNVAHFYATQFRLLRRWSGTDVALVRRALATAAVAVAALLATIWIVPGITVRDVPSAVAAAILLAGVTTLARPLLIGLLSGFSVVLVGIGTIVVQVVAFWLLSRLPSGIAIDGFASAVRGALVYSIADTVLASGLSVGDDNSFFGTLVRQLVVRHRGVERTNRPGIVFIQIDGLAHPVLVRQLEAGRMPTLARWIRSGAMTLDPWEPLLPTQTSASQAGILHGNNDGIPAFRWWEKDGQRLLVSNRPPDAREIMRRVSDGHGLLADGGVSVGNLLSGDAPRSFLTAATVDDPGRELRRSHVLDWFFISPYSYLRWVALSIGEVVKELFQAQRERFARIEPHGARAFPYPLARAATNVLLRHLATALVIEEMYRGAPSIYVDFVDYDEIAHHSGVERAEALGALGGLDKIIALIEKAAADAPRPYRFVVLSDHGQTPGAMFRQRHTKTLEAVIGELAGDESGVRAATSHVEHSGRMNALASEGMRVGGIVGGLSRAPFRRADAGKEGGDQLPTVVVAASGNLAQVSFPKRPGRFTKEAMDEAYPGLVDGLRRHPGIGLVMVRSQGDGTLVMGAGGVRYLDQGRVDGLDPIAPFGPHAAPGLARLDAMANCGDLVIVSQFDRESGEVAAFEEQIGSHGGLGGWQTRGFVIHPADWRVAEPIVGATALHAYLRAWLADAARSSSA